MTTTITQDKYGFIEETEDPIKRPGSGDAIGKLLKATGYIENFKLDNVAFSRYYWEKKVVVDIFKRATYKDEIEVKDKICRTNKIIYVPIEKGSGKFTAGDLKKYLKNRR